MTHAFLWVPFTLVAALGQVLRNGAQAGLTARIGTLGATQVRFVFGFPFAVLFLCAALLVTGARLPALTGAALGWVALGAVAQIAGTALMLVVMQARSFGVAYAYIKTEPVLVALLGVFLLGDMLAPLAWVAIALVTLGVVLASTRPGDIGRLLGEARPVLIGTAGGACFGLSAIAFRGSIDSLPEGGFVLRSLTMLVLSLGLQTLMLGVWLALRDRAAFLGSVREWRTSIGAGFLGALASAGWFIAFSLTNAANVRTLGLVEMPIAALLSRRISGKWLAPHEGFGFALIMGGVALLLAAHSA
ncbi:DMT family transporter [Novosphingobium album (ex Liu et al. 2023)]|uniref:DMT family transporter n=1 Tax=Novosphingobium album (ex Liu et al. 2023) TaxID=3031130 RepID=A0ABT5WW77_9SPHN|nr:DMT family transporter [Novosphingobium album (ex Liu et al. 2023)]MDE8654112.1 DMT family transporter [Novosphingobium album (ex Liu et al. 2023)]